MPLHLVGTRAPATVRLNARAHFDGHWQVLSDAHEPGMACRKGERLHPVEDCFWCPRFVAWSPDGDSSRMRIECHWTERDPVGARMTMASALVTVAADTPAWRADDVARQVGVRHLLVMDAQRVAGVLCRCDLFGAPAHLPVSALATREVFAISPRSGIGEAATAMAALGIGLLPVVADEILVGVLSRGDLRRAGVPEQLLGAHRCCACGSRHGVRPDPRCASIDMCLDCLERATEPPDETGDGD